MNFEWFEEEIKQVQWKTFHILGRDITKDKLQEICPFDVDGLPEDLRAFILRYGNCKLFRLLSSDSYYLILKFKVGNSSDSVFNTGGDWREGECYVKQNDPAIYCKTGSNETRCGNFTSWLKSRMRRCRKEFSENKWQMLLKPPPPFNDEERKIVEAISSYKFKKVWITPERNVLIEIENNSP